MTTFIILSDNHGDLQVISDILSSEKYDIAIHLGDYLCESSFMKKHFDFYVAGNNDFDFNAKESYELEIEGLRISLQHGHLIGSYEQLEDVNFMINYANKYKIDILMFGHTHTPLLFTNKSVTLINPGSTSLPRFGSKSGYVLLTLNEKMIVNLERKTLVRR
ncbi:metallophosphoesterase family protein [Mycoplasma phocimorsus]|uniref:metallophosphoesterase family protein n=1 Tax=Mycoplasma phocimorsus TaxID=3045839 RepID=UPI0024BF565E|nr:YfcE family phosphodiesterase [Mycoplasma phocimorsus]MDJ1646174.1 YfcE family phosphodiesterase [Mycoplasma phocimorsus]MDJ1646771.1 YfcE family phosphodiesterase [Mycoplasma phocimorsus]MDJ1648280.1 YfcE family phosphodiesterase [Mycoplasma phocimorsus]MDJ1648697.1 YfcE family phosphodiesterase [Mycoplasma phocimorsus]